MRVLFDFFINIARWAWAIIATTICFVNQFEQSCMKRKIKSYTVGKHH